MKEDAAKKIVSIIQNVDSAFEELFDTFDLLEEKEKLLFRKELGQIILSIYEKVEIPIYRQYPALPNRRDK